MRYGNIYHKLDDKLIAEISGVNSLILIKFIKLYFKIFGYPDVAGFGRFPIVLKLLNPKKYQMVLDLGCGNGIYANTLAHYYQSKIIGYDLDNKRIGIANKVANSLNLKATFFKKDITNISFPKNYFDSVICIEVIEHVKDDDKLINDIYKVLKKEGKLILSTAKEDKNIDKMNNNFVKVKKGDHVRSGYEIKKLIKKLEYSGFTVSTWQPYYRYFSRFAIKFQQKIYNNYSPFINFSLSPLLNIIALLDKFIPNKKKWSTGLGWYRGFVIEAIKK